MATHNSTSKRRGRLSPHPYLSPTSSRPGATSQTQITLLRSKRWTAAGRCARAASAAPRPGRRPSRGNQNFPPLADSSNRGSGAGKDARKSLRPHQKVGFAFCFSRMCLTWCRNVCAAGLERKMSMRANRDDLVQKGILLPDSSLDLIDHPIAEGKTLCPIFEHV